MKKNEPITPLYFADHADPVDAMRAAFAAALGSWRRLEGLVIVLTPGSAALLTRGQARVMLRELPRVNAEIAEALDAPAEVTCFCSRLAARGGRLRRS